MNEAKKRILVAEADSAARVLLRRRFEAEGYDVSVVEDGESALRAVSESPPDLLVVDVSLPKIDGIQVVRQIRAIGSTAPMPILVLSAYSRDVVERGLAGVRGPDGIFAKPIDYRELQTRVKALLFTGSVVAGGTNHAGEAPGRMVAFVGAKGGVGTTTVALNVAVTLARQGSRIILVETARFRGALGSLIGLVGTGSIDLLALDDPERMTAAAVDGVLRAHPSGVRILAGASSGRSVPPAEGVMALGNALRALSHQVVVDLDSAVDVYGQVVLRTAERIWVVTEPEPIGIERSGALVAMLEAWGVDRRSIALLVNQTSPEMVMVPSEIGQQVGRPVGCWVPCAAAATFEANRRGVPLVELARDHPAAGALAALAESVLGRQAVVAR